MPLPLLLGRLPSRSFPQQLAVTQLLRNGSFAALLTELHRYCFPDAGEFYLRRHV
jgi:hypothetical protein